MHRLPWPRLATRRALAVASTLLVAIAAMPIGASAAPPSGGGTSSVSVSVDADCLATVTYSWQGFKGKNLVAELVLAEPAGSISFGLAYEYVTGLAGTSGTAVTQFQLTIGGTDQPVRFGAIGRLGKFDRNGLYKETIAAAQATGLGPSNSNGCGYPIS